VLAFLARHGNQSVKELREMTMSDLIQLNNVVVEAARKEGGN
jgi:hypothetical protein